MSPAERMMPMVMRNARLTVGDIFEIEVEARRFVGSESLLFCASGCFVVVESHSFTELS